MEDPGRIEWRHWANYDQNHVKDFFRDQMAQKLMDVLAERDAAFAERDSAIAERKSAYAERDAALIQRDTAYAERNAAWMERDNALAALRMVRANKDNPETAAKLMQLVHCPSMEPTLLALPPIGCGQADDGEPNHSQKQLKRQGKKLQHSPKKQKGSGAHDTKSGKSSSKKKRKQQNQQDIVKPKEEVPEMRPMVPYEISIPYCSCTGTSQQCYRWGNGGWQSACCTKFISAFPLPMNPAKHGSRIAGRKMSGGAFKKLLEKLVGDGVDVRVPIDLKNHWAKHGTNGYVTIK